MTWIKIESCTPDKPEIFAMADRLGISPENVLGGLVRFWVWADQQSVDGYAISVTKTILDRITSVHGMGDAMIHAGWLDDNDGVLSLPNFDRHNGKSAKARALAAKRMEKHRSGCNALVTLQTSPEKRREEKKETLTNGDAPKRRTSKKDTVGSRRFYDGIPEALCTPAFLSAWMLWIDHRIGIPKKFSDNAVALQLKKLGEMGEDQAIAAIEFSVMNGYQGIFEPKGGSIAKEPMPWDK